MPRIPRGFGDNQVYHVINRGNARNKVFHKDDDYISFIRLLKEAIARHPVKLYAYSLMPNHFHFLMSPYQAKDLSSCMQWLMTSHVRRYHTHYGSTGHIWQGRFKSFIVEEDSHIITVDRYIEGNPVRGGIVTTAAAWPWSSHAESAGLIPCRFVSCLPVELPEDWTHYVDTPLNEAELEKMRRSISRQTPYGDEQWQKKVALDYNLEATLHPIGRPRKSGEA